MSSKYQKSFAIPEGFPALLKGFTREVLRAQPDNIYEFGAQYFQDLLSQKASDKGDDAVVQNAAPQATPAAPITLDNLQQAAAALDLASISPADLEPILLRLFLEADLDRSGYLDRHEFARVLRAGRLNLTDRQVREVLAEADENEDGLIQYEEFMPVMLDVLHSLRAKEEVRGSLDQIEDAARTEVAGLLLHGLPPNELEAIMLNVFKKADVDGSGQLSRSEFKRCLKASKLGLTRQDVNLLLAQVDTNKDGLVSYEEFIPVCFQVLVERFKDDLVHSAVLKDQEGLQGFILAALQAADPEGAGVLNVATVKAVLRNLSYQTLGLSAVQVLSLISQAPVDPAGNVDYVKFVPLAAATVGAMHDVNAIKRRVQAINEISIAGGIQALSKLDLNSLKEALLSAFRAADEQGTGQLTESAAFAALDTLHTLENLSLSDAHWRVIFAAIDVDESGTMDWQEMAAFITAAIEHAERDAYVLSKASSTAG